jgi:preprotein translocase subunit SecD
MSVPSAQRLKETVTPAIPVPGGDAPSTANISAACTTGATALAALFNANIGQIQGFATGGG